MRSVGLTPIYRLICKNQQFLFGGKMENQNEWQSVINGKQYDFSYQIIQKKPNLFINGEPTVIKPGFWGSFFGVEQEINLDGQEATFAIPKKTPDIAVNGVFLRSGKPFEKRPFWVFIFAAICLAIPIASLGGALPFLLGFGGAALCMMVSRSSLKPFLRVIVCVLITLVAWGLLLALLFFLAAL